MPLLPLDGRGPPERKVHHPLKVEPKKPEPKGPAIPAASFTPATKKKPPLVMIPGRYVHPGPGQPHDGGLAEALHALAVLWLVAEGSIVCADVESIIRNSLELTSMTERDAATAF